MNESAVSDYVDEVSEVGSNRVMKVARLSEKKEKIKERIKKAKAREDERKVVDLKKQLSSIENKIAICVNYSLGEPGRKPPMLC